MQVYSSKRQYSSMYTVYIAVTSRVQQYVYSIYSSMYTVCIQYIQQYIQQYVYSIYNSMYNSIYNSMYNSMYTIQCASIQNIISYNNINCILIVIFHVNYNITIFTGSSYNYFYQIQLLQNRNRPRGSNGIQSTYRNTLSIIRYIQ